MWQRAAHLPIPAPVLFVNPVRAGTVRVPSQQPTIQAGIDAASEADTVMVAAGTYTGSGNQHINPGGRSPVLKSEEGPEATVINGGGNPNLYAPCFSYCQGENSTSAVDGFVVWRGESYLPGGGVYLSVSSPTFKSCRFERIASPEHWYRDCVESPRAEEWECRCSWQDQEGGGRGGPVLPSGMDGNGLISINDLVLLARYIHGDGAPPCCAPPREDEEGFQSEGI